MSTNKLMFENEEEMDSEFSIIDLEDELFDLRAEGRSKEYLVKLLIERKISDQKANEIVDKVDENYRSYKISNAKLMIIGGSFLIPIGIIILFYSEIESKMRFFVLITGGILLGRGLNTLFYYKNEKDQQSKPYWKRD